MSGKKVDFIPEDDSTRWESGRLASEITDHNPVLGFSYSTADVVKDGVLHEDVTVIPPDKDK